MEYVNLLQILGSSKVEDENPPPREGAFGETRDSVYCALLGMTGQLC